MTFDDSCIKCKIGAKINDSQMVELEKHVIIIGGGAFGLSTALHLTEPSQNKYKVTILDRLPIPATDASSTDLNKIIRCEYGSQLEYRDLALEAIERWKAWNVDYQAGNSSDGGLFHQTGVLFACADANPDSIQKQSFDSLNHLVPNLVPNEAIDASKWPVLQSMRAQFGSGYFNPICGWANSTDTVKFMAVMLERRGVSLVTGIDGFVTSIKHVRLDSQWKHVITVKSGKHYECDICVLATGAWSSSLVPELSDVLVATAQPVAHYRIPPDMQPLFEQSNVVWTADLPRTGFYGFPMRRVSTSGETEFIVKVAWHSSGCLTAPSVPENIVVPKDTFKVYDAFTKQVFPDTLGKLAIHSTRICWYTDTFDGNFIIGPVTSTSMNDERPDSFVVATGGSGHGFKFAPVIGKIVVDAIEKRETRFTRFFAWRENKNNTNASDALRMS